MEMGASASLLVLRAKPARMQPPNHPSELREQVKNPPSFGSLVVLGRARLGRMPRLPAARNPQRLLREGVECVYVLVGNTTLRGAAGVGVLRTAAYR